MIPGKNEIFQRLRECTDTIGSYECGACLGGNTENADGDCTDFDECANGVHNCTVPGGFCENIPGTFDCPSCVKGFVGPDGHDCTDIDECEFDTHDCNVAVRCQNTLGSYKCDGCKRGYIGTGESCSDENECTRPVCKEFENTVCINNIAWFQSFLEQH